MLTLRILEIITPVIAIIFIGYYIGRAWQPDMRATNRIALDILGPMLVFTALARRGFEFNDALPLLGASIAIVIGSGIVAWVFAKIIHSDPRVFVPPMMFNNCGNMGIPLALFAFGQDGLSAMVVLFVTSNLLHFTLGTWLVNHQFNLQALAKSPMIWATAIGAVFGALNIQVPESIFVPLKYLGDATIPMMLLALGVRMKEVTKEGLPVALIGAAVCPLAGMLIAALIDALVSLTPLQRGMIYLFSVLPPAVLNFLVAERYNREPETVASIVLIGNLASVVFVPLGLIFALR